MMKLGRPGRLVVRDGLGVLERPAILEVSCDPSRTKSMTTGGIGESGPLCPLVNSVIVV
jgi:hypothetical protein